MCQSAYRRPLGFSLVELLVVIGIIGLLIAVLLPTLAKARRAAELVRCQSNLRQIGAAAFLFAADHKGFAPYPERRSWNPPIGPSPTTKYSGWSKFFYQWYGGKKAIAGTYAGKPYFDGVDERPLNKYVNVKSDGSRGEVFRCPSDSGDANAASELLHSAFEAYGTSYFYSYRNVGLGDGFGEFPVKLSDVRQSSKVVFFADFSILQYQYTGTVDVNPGVVVYKWHNTRQPYANICFADGHVGYHPVKLLPYRNASTEDYTFYRGKPPPASPVFPD